MEARFDWVLRSNFSSISWIIMYCVLALWFYLTSVNPSWAVSIPGRGTGAIELLGACREETDVKSDVLTELAAAAGCAVWFWNIFSELWKAFSWARSTKKASPAPPSFILNATSLVLTESLTIRQESPFFPALFSFTWNGLQDSTPAASLTATTSIAPVVGPYDEGKFLKRVSCGIEIRVNGRVPGIRS